MKVGRKILEWDESQILEDEIKDRLENWEDHYYEEKPDEETVTNEVYNSYGIMEDQWEFLLEDLNGIIKKRNPDGYWFAEVSNFGWRGLDGHSYCHADNAKDFLSKILPKTDCTFRIFNYGKGFAIQNFHHDSPMGKEWYYIKPIAVSTYYKNK